MDHEISQLYQRTIGCLLEILKTIQGALIDNPGFWVWLKGTNSAKSGMFY